MASININPIDLYGIRAIRSALLVGLDVFAETERTRTMCELAVQAGEMLLDGVVPRFVDNEDPFSEFVNAFKYLETAEWVVSNAGDADPMPIPR